MRHVCIGYDPRQPLSYNVMRHSVERHASQPIPIIALILDQLPITREGATQFTFSRFLTPWVSGQQGYSVFCDEDQIVLGDIHELLAFCEQDGEHSVWVNKDQPRFEWPSVMVFRNDACDVLTPEFVQDPKNSLYDFEWADSVGSFPPEWNHCVGYEDGNPNIELVGQTKPKLIHYTMGIPFWPECRPLGYVEEWEAEYQAMVKSVDWIDLHRHTKHYPHVMQRFLRKYGINIDIKEKAA